VNEIMNFLNDSLKTLKKTLAEGLEQKVDYGEDDETETSAAGSAGNRQEQDNLKKLCQHQSDEVNLRTFRNVVATYRRVVSFT
jgi:hypothetical protein